MIERVETYLNHWARWAKSSASGEVGLGRHSSWYNLMRDGMATTRRKYRRKGKTRDTTGRPLNLITAQGKPPAKKTPPPLPDDRDAERVELAVLKLPPELQRVVYLRYLKNYNSKLGADFLRVSTTQWHSYVDNAHHRLDVYLFELDARLIAF